MASSAQLSELELQVLDNEDTISDLWIRQLTAEAYAARGVAGKEWGAGGGEGVGLRTHRPQAVWNQQLTNILKIAEVKEFYSKQSK